MDTEPLPTQPPVPPDPSEQITDSEGVPLPQPVQNVMRTVTGGVVLFMFIRNIIILMTGLLMTAYFYFRWQNGSNSWTWLIFFIVFDLIAIVQLYKSYDVMKRARDFVKR